jgi:NO-binding membrane sensor protein with MHYT domain
MSLFINGFFTKHKHQFDQLFKVVISSCQGVSASSSPIPTLRLPLMNALVTTSYDPFDVLLSFVISIVGSFIALTAARKIVTPNGSISMSNVVAAGLSLGGIGVWSMHFMGMLALKMDLGVSYSLMETLLSLVAAVVATSLALAFVARRPQKLQRIAAAGLVLGLGVTFMHYFGMAGMRFGGYIQWSYTLIAASMVIAIVAATAALWLAFNTRTVVARSVAAVIMGLAVCAMHYTGMMAADFICTTDNRLAVPTGTGVISSMDLPTLVTMLSLSIALVLSLDQIMQRVLAKAR